MLVRILEPKGFVSEKVSFEPATLLGLTELNIELQNSELCVTKEGSVLAKFGPFGLQAALDSQSNLATISIVATKTPIAEVENFDWKALQSALEVHNRKARSRNPLTAEFMTRNRESLISVKHGQVANFRGLFNVLIVFTVVNYSRQMFLHVREQGVLPNLFAAFFATFVDSNVVIFMALGALYVFGAHALQVAAFRRGIKEATVTGLMILASGLYLYALQAFGLRMKIPVSRLTSNDCPRQRLRHLMHAEGLQHVPRAI